MSAPAIPTRSALVRIVPGIGTVVLRPDGVVTFTDRNRCTATIDADVVRAIVELARMAQCD